MPRRRISVRKIKEDLRLKLACGLTDRQVARSIGVARSTAAVFSALSSLFQAPANCSPTRANPCGISN